VRAGLIDEIVAKIDPADLIFESPQRAQQCYMVRKLGSEVNIGNIATTDVIGLETLRLGLRADTMSQFHEVEQWNRTRDAALEAELPHPERRARAGATDTATPPKPRRHLSKIG